MSRRTQLVNAIKELKKTKKIDSTQELKPVPDKFEDFCPLVTIRSGSGFQPFQLYDYQRKLIDMVQENFSTVVVKTRQLGISETAIAYLVWDAVKNGGTNAVVFSMNQQATSNLAKRARIMIESVPGYAKLVTDSLQILSFSNGSTIFFRNATINGSRGLESIKTVIFDEAEFIPDVGEIYKSVLPCTSMLGSEARILIISTPGKESGWYFDRLMSNNSPDKDILLLSQKIRNGEIPSQFFVDDAGCGKALLHWRDHPIFGKNPESYLSEVQERFQIGESALHMEYDLSFEDSSESLFSPKLVRDTCTGSLTKTVHPNADYYIGLDSSGSGKDYTVAIVLQELNNKLSVVDIYRERQQTSEYDLYQLGLLIDKYNPIKVGIETNSMGGVILEQAILDRPGTDFEAIKTTAQSKPLMISRLLMAMEDETLTLPQDKRFIQEFLSFQKVGNKMQAVGGKAYDDIVLATSFAITVSDYSSRDKTKFRFKKSKFKINLGDN